MSLKKSLAVSLALFNAIKHPTNGESVATISELTGSKACTSLLARMLRSEEGKLIMKERPLITSEKMRVLASSCKSGTLGDVYLRFMDQHHISADTRAPIRWMDDQDPRAYLLLRYRQIHDFWHILAGNISTSIKGELALKWMEYFQTGLPMTYLAGALAPYFLLHSNDRSELWKNVVPWALKNAPPHAAFLLSIYYERHLHVPLADLRQQLGVIPLKDPTSC